ncbi:carboxylesterase family protein [bacterium]|nr:carboxylesterase family protein [bacterium]
MPRPSAYLLPLLALSVARIAPLQDPIRLTSGPVTGSVADDVRVYKSIPYARPSVGPLRWREPQLTKARIAWS